MPYGLGALLVRDGAALARAHRERRHYVQDVTDEGSLGFADLSPELSRDFRGLRLWLPLQLHGLAPFREQLTEKLRSRAGRTRAAQDERFEVLDEPQLSVVAFRLRAPEYAAERLGPELLRRVNERRRARPSCRRLRQECPDPRRWSRSPPAGLVEGVEHRDRRRCRTSRRSCLPG